MMVLNHPDSFRDGVRFVFLSARPKDGVERPRMISRVSHGVESFNRVIDELTALARPGQRIYGSLDARELLTAAKHFKHAMIDEPEVEFFRRIRSRWESALMQPSARIGRLWLWDCDTPAEADAARGALPGEAHVYTYDTKSGVHIITRPFDLRLVDAAADVTRLRKDNAMMLWAFDAAVENGLPAAASESNDDGVEPNG